MTHLPKEGTYFVWSIWQIFRSFIIRRGDEGCESRQRSAAPLWASGLTKKGLVGSKIITSSTVKVSSTNWVLKDRKLCFRFDCKEQADGKQCLQCKTINGWALNARYCRAHHHHDIHIQDLNKCELFDLVHRSPGFLDHFIGKATETNIIYFCGQINVLGVATDTFWGQKLNKAERLSLYEELSSMIDEIVIDN